MIRLLASVFLFPAAAAALGLAGCVTAAATGAGALAGIELTDQGAKGEVKGAAPDVDRRAEAVFKEMGIQKTATSVEKSGKERTLEGQAGRTDVKVTMEGTGADTTHVEVVAKSGTVSWEKDYAKQILTNIVQKG